MCPGFSRKTPVSDVFILAKSEVLIFGLQNMITLVIGEPVLCEVMLETDFSHIASKMILSSTKLHLNESYY